MVTQKVMCKFGCFLSAAEELQSKTSKYCGRSYGDYGDNKIKFFRTKEDFNFPIYHNYILTSLASPLGGENYG